MLQESAAAKAWRVAAEKLETFGRRLEISTDFAAIKAEIEANEKGYLSAEFDPGRSELTARDCRYIVVRDQTEEIEGFCAVRLFNVTEDERLAGFLWDLYRTLYTDGADPFDMDELPPPTFEAFGAVGYVGDFYLMKSGRGAMKIDDTALAMISYAICSISWQADWTFCLTKHRSATRGLAARYACTQTYPCAIAWNVEQAKRRDDDWMMFLKSVDRDWILGKYGRRKGSFSSATP